MADKTAAQWHGAVCSGECCRHNPYGTCFHGHACTHHLKEEARRIRESHEASGRMEAFKSWR